MSYKKNAVVMALMLTVAGTCHADVGATRHLLQSILDEKDESRLAPKEKEFDSIEGDLQSASTDEMRTLLPFAQKFLESPFQRVRDWGMSLFLEVAVLRLEDGAQLIEPYVDSDLAPLLDDPKDRGAVIFILGSTPPAPLPKALAHLAAHLNDKGNSWKDAGSIAGALLNANPSDSATATSVIKLVRQRTELELRGELIRLLGLTHNTTKEGMDFIREGFRDKKPAVRMAAVEAVGRMSSENRFKFTEELQRLLNEPDETTEIRTRALQVLQQ